MGELLEHESEAPWDIELEEINPEQDEYNAVLRHQISDRTLVA